MERDVSVASAKQVVAALRSRGHDVVAVDAERGTLSGADEAATFARDIERKPPPRTTGSGLPRVIAEVAASDCAGVFLAMHGGTGENGTLQALLDVHGVRYTGSGHLGTSLAWDKIVSKQLFVQARIPTPAWFSAPVDVRTIAAELGFPVIVKPAGQGSTVGLSLVDGPDGIEAAIEHAAQYDNEVLIEQFIAGRELTVGVLDGKPLTVGEIVPVRGNIFDYEAKYQADAAKEIFPADVSAEIAQRTKDLALEAHAALRLGYYSRADFRMDEAGNLWCLEVNTLPGLSRGSLLPKSAAAAGIAFDELCERISRAAFG
jgi:D-alanine-D-alanine ligase